jgi:gas vesicle protein
MNKNNGWTMLLAGVGIGAAAGILLARCSGADLRKAIQQRADDATSFLKTQAGTVVDRVTNAAEVGHDRVAAQVAKGKEAVRSLNKNARDFLDTAADTTRKVTGNILD